MNIRKKMEAIRALRGLRTSRGVRSWRELREAREDRYWEKRGVLKERLNMKRIKWYLRRLNEQLSNVCPECYGTGRVADDVCPKCKGLGYINE